MTHERIAAVMAHISPIVMAAATALVVCGLFLWVLEARNNDKLYENQIESCERGQTVRTVLHAFLAAAEKARRMPPLEAGDLETAEEYHRLDVRIWPLKPCSAIVRRP